MWRNVDAYDLFVWLEISAYIHKGVVATYSALRVAICYFNSPGSGPISTIQDVSHVCHWGKYQSSIEDYIQKLMLGCESLDLILLCFERSSSQWARCLLHWPTSSTGTRWMELSTEYFWKSRPWIVVSCKYWSSTSSVSACGSLLQIHSSLACFFPMLYKSQSWGSNYRISMFLWYPQFSSLHSPRAYRWRYNLSNKRRVVRRAHWKKGLKAYISQVAQSYDILITWLKISPTNLIKSPLYAAYQSLSSKASKHAASAIFIHARDGRRSR